MADDDPHHGDGADAVQDVEVGGGGVLVEGFGCLLQAEGGGDGGVVGVAVVLAGGVDDQTER